MKEELKIINTATRIQLNDLGEYVDKSFSKNSKKSFLKMIDFLLNCFHISNNIDITHIIYFLNTNTDDIYLTEKVKYYLKNKGISVEQHNIHKAEEKFFKIIKKCIIEKDKRSIKYMIGNCCYFYISVAGWYKFDTDNIYKKFNNFFDFNLMTNDFINNMIETHLLPIHTGSIKKDCQDLKQKSTKQTLTRKQLIDLRRWFTMTFKYNKVDIRDAIDALLSATTLSLDNDAVDVTSIVEILMDEKEKKDYFGVDKEAVKEWMVKRGIIFEHPEPDVKHHTFTLTHGQLIDLYNMFDCREWKSNIEEIVAPHYLSLDVESIVIEQKYVDLLYSKGKTAHIQAVESIITKPVDNIKKDIENLFWSLFNGCTVRKEGNNIVYRNKNNEWMFAIYSDCFYFSKERVSKLEEEKEYYYTHMRLRNQTIENILEHTLKISLRKEGHKMITCSDKAWFQIEELEQKNERNH